MVAVVNGAGAQQPMQFRVAAQPNRAQNIIRNLGAVLSLVSSSGLAAAGFLGVISPLVSAIGVLALGILGIALLSKRNGDYYLRPRNIIPQFWNPHRPDVVVIDNNRHHRNIQRYVEPNPVIVVNNGRQNRQPPAQRVVQVAQPVVHQPVGIRVNPAPVQVNDAFARPGVRNIVQAPVQNFARPVNPPMVARQAAPSNPPMVARPGPAMMARGGDGFAGVGIRRAH